MRLGLQIGPGDDWRENLEKAKVAESLGIEMITTGEAWGRSTVPWLAALAMEGTVRSQTTDGGTDANRGLVTGLRRSRLRDQRTPASQEQPSLRGERDMGVAAAANAKVLSQLVECAAETRR